MEIITTKLTNGIAVTLRKAAGQDPKPIIILCHGFCGIQPILVPVFAEAFTQAGFTTLTFDYRGFGDSAGERGRLVPAMQIEDILTVIAWAKRQPDVDATRLGLWGTSFGGCHVFGAAADNPDIKCIISQLAFADGEKIVTGKMKKAEKAAFLATLDKMAEKQRLTGKEMFVGITRVLSDDESKAFFEHHKTHFPAMDIKIPFLTVRETLHYKPKDNAAKVTCPTLIILAEKDNVNPPEHGIELYNSLRSRTKQLYIEPDARHYDIYSGDYFVNIIAAQTAWFKQHL
ncbi:esterase [Sodalis glossinidius str. 'morsitans']|uniref:Esterase n=1 Tax=Sodalis glossinidius (strain morsitans) TaxID=343509 RepID=Q2NT34_SODGM|nr:alpha/beta hydrolase [Sodalis glossinidius]BAE74691.1 conserved hypothetical protein [Sodalis glossinidius str. 'morsitans']CRL45443.1 esterase [Sodalis glossinidius str. 'morsitans']